MNSLLNQFKRRLFHEYIIHTVVDDSCIECIRVAYSSCTKVSRKTKALINILRSSLAFQYLGFVHTITLTFTCINKFAEGELPSLQKVIFHVSTLTETHSSTRPPHHIHGQCVDLQMIRQGSDLVFVLTAPLFQFWG